MRVRPFAKLARSTSCAFALLAWCGCNALWGVDGLDFGAGAGGGEATATATGTGGAATSTTSSGTAGGEDCQNGIDDDGDGRIDCADEDCKTAGFSCAPKPPAGWEGPIRVEQGPGVASLCANPWGIEHAVGGLSASKPIGGTCPACSCAAPSGTQCGLDIVQYNDVNCNGSTENTTFVASGTCVNVGNQNFGPKSVKPSSAMKIVAGTCAPMSSGTKQLPAAGWDVAARLCRPTVIGSGCDGEQQCAPPGAGGKLCVAKAGTNECPPGYPKRTIVFETLADGRSCSACTCSKPSGGTCTGAEITTEAASGCGPGGTTLKGACVNLELHPMYGTHALDSFAPGGAIGGACAASGGNVTGTVAGESPISVCCSS